ncbi:ribonuclease P [Corynebacterium occultum]|uniref:Ribonuclease P protein component n=1 Tax=Corynebacterium occultum TaxID=2675219 RepID=A0A6B8WFG1_9CORY|nr:ribonuclease P protein component [Corynebacterium occultum]QGU08710.1 ribonuclease P [Corynebacterium occultum]
MLPRQYKFTSPVQFDRTIKRGQRAGSRTLVVHLWEASAEAEPVIIGGPRFGLIISKAVGNAVVRHRTARRLRHICATLAPELPKNHHLVIRALPRSAEATSAELERDLRRTVEKLKTRVPPR